MFSVTCEKLIRNLSEFRVVVNVFGDSGKKTTRERYAILYGRPARFTKKRVLLKSGGEEQAAPTLEPYHPSLAHEMDQGCFLGHSQGMKVRRKCHGFLSSVGQVVKVDGPGK